MCAELAARDARLWEAMRASAVAGDADGEDRLRNQLQVVLARMTAAGCLVPHTRQ